MPDTITHYLFGLDQAKNSTDSPVYSIIKDNRNLYFIGLQGPDPMYYHAPHKKQNNFGVASLMHQSHTGYFLSSAICFAKKHMAEPELFSPCMAYICGLLCHYALDVTCHPYIFYLGGRYSSEDSSTLKYQGLHKRIEMAIDTLLLQEKFNRHANSFKVHKHILKDVAFPPVILDMYDELLFSIYAIPHGSGIIKESYHDFRNYFALTYDRIGLKKGLASMASPILPKNIVSLANTFSYHDCVDEFTDYLNTKKTVWLHPVTGNVYTHSFYDLLKNAHKLATKLIDGAYSFIQSEISLEELEELLPNVSYLTGLKTSDTRPMQYYKF
ncbi:MAG: zinc dependent phospholipase C family protein [Niameybacter sp.]|uniref:zinc dependent phospholipase C family protein n=1 Tax=Niameybacter sp. TaxID=2033640 RepID=UPI002FCC6320